MKVSSSKIGFMISEIIPEILTNSETPKRKLEIGEFKDSKELSKLNLSILVILLILFHSPKN